VKYATIVADPPWPYEGSGPVGTGGRGVSGVRAHPSPGSDERYGSMSTEDIAALAPPAAANAHLYLWTTNAFMVEAHVIARRWGFEPKTILTWGKVKADGTPSCKTGYYWRGATEHVIFAVRGSLRLMVDEAQPTLWLWPRLPHSQKPDRFYELVERVSPGPYLELFARRRRYGWDVWGNEAPEFAASQAELGLSSLEPAQ
jgi:N6-adenosine-specific RNA methylase IME4